MSVDDGDRSSREFLAEPAPLSRTFEGGRPVAVKARRARDRDQQLAAEDPLGLRRIGALIALGVVIHAADFLVPTGRVWTPLLLGAHLLIVVLWVALNLSLVRSELALELRARAEGDGQARRNADRAIARPYVVFGVLTLVLLFSIVGKGLLWLESLKSGTSEGLSTANQSFTILSLGVFLVGLIGRPRRLERVLTAAAQQTARLMAVSFGLASLVGMFLLMLPFSHQDPRNINIVDSLFEAVSAVCVTGLSVNSVPETYTPFGQGVLFVLFQSGGLGLMVLYGFFVVLAGQRMRVKSSTVMAEMVDVNSLASLRRTLAGVVLVSLAVEGVGAGLLYWSFGAYPDVNLGPGSQSQLAGAGSRLWAAVFHSVSAYCNAGFSLFKGGAAPFAADPAVNVILMALILIGGLGFPVLFELWAQLRHRVRRQRAPRLSLHSKVVLGTNVALVLGGAVVLLALEHGRSFGALPWGAKVLAAFFQSVTTRTAGFNTIDFGAMGPPALLVCCVLMFVGASPGSTGGGAKTTTIAVLFAAFRAELTGQDRPYLFRRSISPELFRRALGVAFISILFILTLTFALLVTETQAPLAIVFEAVSALATVGISTGITGDLTTAGKLMVIVGMFIGRVGPLTVALALAQERTADRYAYPEERIGIG